MPGYSSIELMAMAIQIATYSDGRIRLVYEEQDESEDKDAQSAHFLKLDGRRLGRDIELYGMMSQVMCWEETFVMFFEEVILPLREHAPSSYQKTSNLLMEAGLKVYPPELHQQWQKIFA